MTTPPPFSTARPRPPQPTPSRSVPLRHAFPAPVRPRHPDPARLPPDFPTQRVPPSSSDRSFRAASGQLRRRPTPTTQPDPFHPRRYSPRPKPFRLPTPTRPVPDALHPRSTAHPSADLPGSAHPDFPPLALSHQAFPTAHPRSAPAYVVPAQPTPTPHPRQPPAPRSRAFPPLSDNPRPPDFQASRFRLTKET